MSAAQVLIVEDDPDVAGVMCCAFDDPPFGGASHVLTGADAMRYLDRVLPALVVIDAILPDMQGASVALYAAACGVPSIITSGHPRELSNYTATGFPAVLPKPFRLSELLARAAEAIARSRDNIKEVHAACERVRALRGEAERKMRDSARLTAILHESLRSGPRHRKDGI